jgi:pyruvate kinase
MRASQTGPPKDIEMNDRVREDAPASWDPRLCDGLIEELWTLRQSMLAHAAGLAPWLAEVAPQHAASAINLAHYLALRRVDLRPLQQQLAWLGLSSLGRAETHVLASLDKVLGILHRLAGRDWHALSSDEPVGARSGPARLQANAVALLGVAPPKRAVRIMVTLPSAAATDDRLIAALVGAGMDIARINCAHDDAAGWTAMARRVREAARAAGRPVRVLMDLGGPKLRTGEIAGEAPVLHLKPQRDALGRVRVPARLGLRPAGASAAVDGAERCVGVDADWLARLRVGDVIKLSDARGARRKLTVVDCQGAGCLVEASQGVYLVGETRLRHAAKGDDKRYDKDETGLHDLPATTAHLLLQRGDRLDLVASGIGRPAQDGQPAQVVCTLPEALPRIRVGERVWFDDGHIGGVVRHCTARRVEVEITQAREGGERLAADKGINLPDTALDLPALTAQDLEDLAVVAREADLVGLSFAQSAGDVRALRERLAALDAAQLGLVLKIETRRGFEHLPEMLLAAMAGPCAGVMIARGDLAVECGYERMAEVQEEILWACEAAHMPVIWATQVLETLAKTGLPSRAEITDAAMGERAECVMLNKGPHIVEAMRTLDDILRRMQDHQSKKRPLLRALKSWSAALEAPGRVSGRRSGGRPRSKAGRRLKEPATTA